MLHASALWAHDEVLALMQYAGICSSSEQDIWGYCSLMSQEQDPSMAVNM